MKLKPEDLQKIHDKQVANIIRKLGDGKTLTAREQKILDDQTAVAESPTSGIRETANFAQNWDELADAIPIDRRTLYNFRQANGDVIKQRKKQLDRADGRHCVAAWRALLEEFEVRGRGLNNPETDFIDIKQLQLRERLLKVEREEFELEKAKSLMLKIAEFEAALGVMVANFNSAINALPGRAAGKLLPRARAALINSLRKNLDEKTFKLADEQLGKDFAIDYADIEETLQTEVDLVKRSLESCDYLTAEENLE